MIRKHRTKPDDNRIHIVYVITAINGKQYIGVTAKIGTIDKSLKRRWVKHVSRAMCENWDWSLCKAIRELGRDKFRIDPLHLIRTKTLAHLYERKLINQLRPILNTHVRSGKAAYVPYDVRKSIQANLVDSSTLDANMQI
jgi:hypothetical protein